MTTKNILFIAILFVFSISCSKEVVSDTNLNIAGITKTNETGFKYDTEDPDDWNLNDNFTEREKLLFDTLNFVKRATATPMPTVPNSIQVKPFIIFYANPIKFGNGSIVYYHDKHIINMVIVDNKYNKFGSYRFDDMQHFMFDLSHLKVGILYRIYYVIQDENYNIVHLGHGDILKEN